MTSVNSPACLLARNHFYRNVESSARLPPEYGLSECLTQPKQRIPSRDEKLDDQRGAAGAIPTLLSRLWAEQSSQPHGEVEWVAVPAPAQAPNPEEQTSGGGQHSSAWLSSTLSLLCTVVWT